jgi:hypothetical protein
MVNKSCADSSGAQQSAEDAGGCEVPEQSTCGLRAVALRRCQVRVKCPRSRWGAGGLRWGTGRLRGTVEWLCQRDMPG